MKKIGIIFAMKEEMDELLKYIHLEKETSIYDLVFYEGTISNTKCILVESGIGKVNAARSTQVLIDNYEVDYIFNIGVAGGVSKDINICDLVVANELVQHDFDITVFNHEKGYIPKIGIYIKCNKELNKIASKIKLRGTSIHNGVVASGDIFCSEEWMGEKIHNKFNALCVEMEGASIAQVCYLCKKPFLVIRSISDSPYQKNNKLTHEEFLTKSSKKVAEFLNKMVIEMECKI